VFIVSSVMAAQDRVHDAPELERSQGRSMCEVRFSGTAIAPVLVAELEALGLVERRRGGR
jgi:hypothetical protein